MRSGVATSLEATADAVAGGLQRVPQCPCGGSRFVTVHTFTAPPKGETPLPFADVLPYRRQLCRCATCGHFVSHGAVPTEDVYRGEYVSATYGRGDGIRAAYDRIMALDPAESDNVGRVDRVLDLVRQHRPKWRSPGQRPSVLDIGSGLCVFLAQMKVARWQCTALDPDERAAEHAREVVQVNAVCVDFQAATELGRFDLITINKVLEHVEDPIAMLERCREFLWDDGVVYIEVPDGEEAIKAGPQRQEFYNVHIHVFSMASLALLIDRAGFRCVRMERLHDPSGKYTMWAFLSPAERLALRSRCNQRAVAE